MNFLKRWKARRKVVKAAPIMQQALSEITLCYHMPDRLILIPVALARCHHALVASGYYDKSDEELKAFMLEAKRAKSSPS